MEITVICPKCIYIYIYIFILVYYSKFLRAGIRNSGDLRRGTRGSFGGAGVRCCGLVVVLSGFFLDPCVVPCRPCH